MKKNERIDLLLEVIGDYRIIGKSHYVNATDLEKRALSAEADLAIEQARVKKLASDLSAMTISRDFYGQKKNEAERELDARDDRYHKNIRAAADTARKRVEKRIATLESTTDTLRADVLAMEEHRDAAVKELEHVKGIVLGTGVDPATLRRAVELAVRVEWECSKNPQLEIGEAIAKIELNAEYVFGAKLTDAILAHIAAEKPKAPAPPALFKVGDRVRTKDGVVGKLQQNAYGGWIIETDTGDLKGWYLPESMTLLSPQMDNQ